MKVPDSAYYVEIIEDVWFQNNAKLFYYCKMPWLKLIYVQNIQNIPAIHISNKQKQFP